ncbi:glyoxal oxidase N-terminus-domain-containing protein [Mycena crocata]|nr:glyoxal oxidase N-terminus-domain-containing protein [Mycena crocata]
MARPHISLGLSVLCVIHTCAARNHIRLDHTRRQSVPTTLPGNWTSKGCYTDGQAGGRTFSGATFTNTTGMTVEGCLAFCSSQNFVLAGVEFAQECYCDNFIKNGATDVPLAECNMPCTGNAMESCGAGNRLNVFDSGKIPPPPPGPATGLPKPWTYVGCFVDNAHGRIVANQEPDDAKLTIDSCVDTCKAQNFTLAAAEFADQCFCGDELIAGATSAPEPDCNMGCAGNSTELCGGGSRMSVYSTSKNVTILPVPVAQNTSIPGSWTYQGCLMEADGTRVLPWQNIYPSNNSATTCLSQCAAFGYEAGGMEFGRECYCGDITDVEAAGVKFAPESDCNLPCTGDPIHLCGGGARIQYYKWTGTPLHVWNDPPNKGYYDFLVPGVTVPLLATVGINGKVSFLEKSPSYFNNGTGAYELDLTLVDDFGKAWREMHVKSNVFCSGSIVLPDKGGRILNVGGWSLDSTKGVRMYTPDGSAGVNGTNDWQENFRELALQRQRWYPTAAVLANGSVLVIGGEIGANDKAQPNLEILPTPVGGDTVIDLDWLQRTDPNNLYPFVYVLPSGNIFIIYYNEARILNPHTFDTIKQLPNLPASVNNFLGGRTYPLEGAAVMFPQHAPYTDPVRVLTCGGSSPPANIALDNCVSIEPEGANPTWTLERMPSQRVMPCMVPLPDGTFMIMNGAHQGVAGFGLGNDPNLGALLYDPTKPVNQRISILNTTIVPRMYHSEAILLPDARVLVSGSDPESPDLPQETRIEAYYPPYLTTGLVQPNFTIATTDWAYGSSHPIVVYLYQGTTATMKVSLIAAVSSTHGNAMGSRTIFPAFKCTGTTCTITAPPNSAVSPPGWHQLFILDGPTPSHSAWVRIGGDPAKLGNWPDLPDFVVPGV